MLKATSCHFVMLLTVSEIEKLFTNEVDDFCFRLSKKLQTFQISLNKTLKLKFHIQNGHKTAAKAAKITGKVSL